ncbi:hypothetical protein ACFQL7_20890 [Halocatena marina]|uniref:Uncharacterized protein n=1 Tax=Halocatena marina TaxID=2934937 RepID=A0ABD5YUX1_9EURY|nr:hypothetical protein [Halocatena marina]
MVNARIATSAEQPINRDGAVSQYAGEEAELVGMNASGELVMADAASGTAVNAVGILAAPVTDPADYSQVPEVQDIVISKREIIGENRIAFAKYGALIVNSDEDWGFTPGQPVYLGLGGGFTQTKPSAAGEIVQVVGMATGDGEEIFLDVESGYSTV